MSLALGLVVLALAVLIGGVAAIWRDHGHAVMPGLGTFATIASVAIAILHLLPESIADIGWPAVLAIAAAFFGPFLIERLIPHRPESEDGATLFIMYGAVLLHQAGEGAAVASIARTSGLGISLILAIAAHTAPLAMVVAIQASGSVSNAASNAKKGTLRAMAALFGCIAATTGGALSLDVVGASRIATMKPWLIASVAGLLLHALTHAPSRDAKSAKTTEVIAGLLGLAVALASLEKDGWLRHIGWPLRGLGVLVLAIAVVVKTTWPKKVEEHPARSAERDPRVG